MTATIAGRTYEIPDAWMMGACRFGMSPADAVQRWHEQALMEEQHEAQSAAEHIDVILRTPLSKIMRVGDPGHGAQRSKAIRDVFRALGWSKFFRVTKGCWSLGADIEWSNGYKPVWHCDEIEALMEQRRHSNAWINVPACCCPTCKRRESQRSAVARRIHYVLNVAFSTGREFGDRSDTQSDYFDADYTFHP